jgi:hypothetical protein
MNKAEKLLKELERLPPGKQGEVLAELDALLKKRASSKRAAALARLAGCLTPREAAELAAYVEEAFEQVEDAA